MDPLDQLVAVEHGRNPHWRIAWEHGLTQTERNVVTVAVRNRSTRC